MFNPLLAKGSENETEVTARGYLISRVAMLQWSGYCWGKQNSKNFYSQQCCNELQSKHNKPGQKPWEPIVTVQAMQHIILYLSSIGTKTCYTRSNRLASPSASPVCATDASSSTGSAVRHSSHCSAAAELHPSWTLLAHTAVSQKKDWSSQLLLQVSCKLLSLRAHLSHSNFIS